MAARRRESPDSDYGSNPRDYYFHVQTDPAQNQMGDDLTEVYFTSANYFDREGAQSDWHISDYLGDVLPELGLGEEAEGMCTTEETPANIRAQLLARGFRESPAFARLALFPRILPEPQPDEVVEGDFAFSNSPDLDTPYVEPPRRVFPGDFGARRTPPEQPQPRSPRTVFDHLNDESPPQNVAPPPPKATAYDKILEDGVIPGEQPPTPAAAIEIGIVAQDPRKVTLPCDHCDAEAIYTFQAAKRLLGCCGSSGCIKPIVEKLETWAFEAKSKSWDILSEDEDIEPKPKLSAREEILQFQKDQKIPETGDLDSATRAALKVACREGMISIWKSRLQEESEDSV